MSFCLCCKRRLQLHYFVCGYPVFPELFVQETVLSSLRGLGTLVKDYLTFYARVYLGLFFVLLIYISVVMPVPPDCFDYYSFCYVTCFDIRKHESSDFFFFKLSWLPQVPWDSIWILRWFWNSYWDFIRDYIESVDHFG